MAKIIPVVSGVLIQKMLTKFAMGEREEWKVLACQRRADQTMALKWHLPGGKLEENETFSHALIREIVEELHTEIVPGDEIANFMIKYPHGLFQVRFYRIMGFVNMPSNDSKEHNEIRWCSDYDLNSFPVNSWLEGDWYVAKLALMEMRDK